MNVQRGIIGGNVGSGDSMVEVNTEFLEEYVCKPLGSLHSGTLNVIVGKSSVGKSTLEEMVKKMAGKNSSEVLKEAMDVLKDIHDQHNPPKPEPDYYDYGPPTSCSCHTGNPPCSFCTDYTECINCGEITHNDDITETVAGFTCYDCIDEEKYKDV